MTEHVPVTAKISGSTLDTTGEEDQSTGDVHRMGIGKHELSRAGNE